MSIFDTHCHLFLPELKNKLNETIKEAREDGVKYFLIPGIDINTSKEAVAIAYNYQRVYAAVGIHPTQDLEKLAMDKTLYRLQTLIDENDFVQAVGEIGLDYYRYKSPKRLQKKFLNAQLKLAIKNDLPVILHNRHATADIISLLESIWSPSLEGKIVFHCSQPDEQILNFALKRQSYIGIDGDITYDKEKQNFVKSVSVKMLLLETDSPYLTPYPMREKKKFPNTPQNLVYVAKKVAELKKMRLEEVIQQTTLNAKSVFDIKA